MSDKKQTRKKRKDGALFEDENSHSKNIFEEIIFYKSRFENKIVIIHGDNQEVFWDFFCRNFEILKIKKVTIFLKEDNQAYYFENDGQEIKKEMLGIDEETIAENLFKYLHQEHIKIIDTDANFLNY